jgi:SAM-dependent methyltransferase
VSRDATEDDELPAGFQAELDDLARAYLATDDPLLQSGFGGGVERWRPEREPLLAAVTEGGSFLDVGCANGFLLASLVAWAGERGVALEPWGVDRSAELIALARARLPGAASHLFVADAWSWRPPRRFRYVYSLHDVVPESHLRAYVARVLERAVEPGGVLVLGAYGSRSRGVAPLDVAGLLAAFGYTVVGESGGGAGPLTRFAWTRAPGAR